MSTAFQEFGQARRLVVAGASISVVLIVVAVCAATSINHTRKLGSDAAGWESGSSNELHSASKAMKDICSVTDFKQACESTITKAVSVNKTAEPKEFILTAVSVVGAAPTGDSTMRKAS
ncbi:hypothetical protein HPP92_009011 [Vanilla planifolia]|uniref:Uncharacterized protein n=1 Tax=Vanilla planifolia TaxID=51239 RepID=A0A835RD12_VANPL|nr:hypothetical protein HPP92_009011 [Vanilla planifolia]